MPNLIALGPHSRVHNGWDAKGGNFIMSVQGQSKRQSLLRPDSNAIFLLDFAVRARTSYNSDAHRRGRCRLFDPIMLEGRIIISSPVDAYVFV
jgi:hypothetical protein